MKVLLSHYGACRRFGRPSNKAGTSALHRTADGLEGGRQCDGSTGNTGSSSKPASTKGFCEFPPAQCGGLLTEKGVRRECRGGCRTKRGQVQRLKRGKAGRQDAIQPVSRIYAELNADATHTEISFGSTHSKGNSSVSMRGKVLATRNQVYRDMRLYREGMQDFRDGDPYDPKRAEKWRDGYRWAVRAHARDVGPQNLTGWQREIIRPCPRFSKGRTA